MRLKAATACYIFATDLQRLLITHRNRKLDDILLFADEYGGSEICEGLRADGTTSSCGASIRMRQGELRRQKGSYAEA
jgi:hypothetical protein